MCSLLVRHAASKTAPVQPQLLPGHHLLWAFGGSSGTAVGPPEVGLGFFLTWLLFPAYYRT